MSIAPAARAGHELFIYYRALPEHAAALTEAAHRMQGALCVAQPGLAARLLYRPEPRDGLQTWMEVYVLPAEADAMQTAAAIEHAANAALAPWLASARHVEHFTTCAS